MAKTIKDTGKYFIPAQFDNAGEVVSYDYEYQQFDSVDDACDTLGEDEVLDLVQRQHIIDCNNKARVQEKAKNKHSVRPPMSPETKAKLKAKRAEDNALLKAIAEKGYTLEDIKNL